MKTDANEKPRLGDLVVAAFDAAARHSADPKEIAHLAAQVVTQLLQYASEALIQGQLSAASSEAEVPRAGGAEPVFRGR